MIINFGNNKYSKENIIWDSTKVINGHMIIIGASGTGKTYRIREMLSELKSQSDKARFHILDVHGDIEIDGSSSVSFSETNEYGLNPLRISRDRDFGGVRKRIRSFVSMINRTSRKLGSKQETAIMALLEDLYNANGFYKDDYKTWDVKYDTRKNRNPKFPKRNPTISDLKKFSYYKVKQMLTGSGSKALYSLEQLNKNFLGLDRGIKKQFKGESVDLTKLKDKRLKSYREYIKNIETGREMDDFIKYDNKDVIKSVYERITNLEASGIFKSKVPPFDKSKSIWRYDIKSLNKDEQKMFVDVICEMIFLNAKQSGQSNDIKDFIIIDEAHIFVSNEDDHILNIIIKEARKFGVGLILASQSFGHFSEDIIANTSSKVILGIDESYHEVSAKKIGVDKDRFNRIVPHKTAMIQIKNKGDYSNKFTDINFKA